MKVHASMLLICFFSSSFFCCCIFNSCILFALAFNPFDLNNEPDERARKRKNLVHTFRNASKSVAKSQVFSWILELNWFPFQMPSITYFLYDRCFCCFCCCWICSQLERSKSFFSGVFELEAFRLGNGVFSHQQQQQLTSCSIIDAKFLNCCWTKFVAAITDGLFKDSKFNKKEKR